MLGLNVGQTWSVQHRHPAESSKDTQMASSSVGSVQRLSSFCVPKWKGVC